MSVTGGKSTVKEPNVNDNDQQVRTLLADAAGHVPPGIDLLHGFRARKAARRVRGRVALAAAAASVVAAATAVTLTIATAPSALAQLASAASRTAGLSYDISATVATVPLRADRAAPAIWAANHPSDTGGGPPRRSRSRCTPGHAGNPVHPTPQRETDMRIKNGSRHNQ